MGTYLSTPVTEKDTEEGLDLKSKRPISWGVVDMQGWRKSMEDAHIIQTDVPAPKDSGSDHDAQVFAVFDGHGGAEVARFCQLYFLDMLTRQEEWTSSKDYGQALVGAFHALDRLIDDPSRRDEINSLRLEKPKPHERRSVDGSAFLTANDENSATSESGFEDEKKIEDINDDSDGDEKVGEIENEGRLDKGDDSDDEVDISPSEDTVSLFKKLLSVSLDAKKSSGTAVVPSEDGSGSSEEALSVITPTKILNGRQVCNLPDHPIHAGCTAVCAVIVANNLIVANAGDSRVVLCQAGGKTEAMSFDHKPLSEIEMKRITAAGGFVNQFGRVNGNLNLSRSIGDLKYKQVPGITPAEQMITAEPDIKQVALHSDDEFIILACDGIWDCLTNEEAVKYVLDRIDTRTPKEIGIEMLDEIISVDPRATSGIGGDNMTVMVVDLRPETRSYRKSL